MIRNGIFCKNRDEWFHFNKGSQVRLDKTRNMEWISSMCASNNGNETENVTPSDSRTVVVVG
jgi:hypothetical protein